MGAKTFIHAIPGKKNLCDVVEEILHEELDGPDGQEGQDDARHEHTENVAEIRAEGDFDVFEDVAGSGAALVDTGEQGFEVFSSMMIWAHSRARSALVSVTTPTSASRKALASLAPSPRKPTQWPTARKSYTSQAAWEVAIKGYQRH
jgi:hypothetical protein